MHNLHSNNIEQEIGIAHLFNFLEIQFWESMDPVGNLYKKVRFVENRKYIIQDMFYIKHAINLQYQLHFTSKLNTGTPIRRLLHASPAPCSRHLVA